MRADMARHEKKDFKESEKRLYIGGI